MAHDMISDPGPSHWLLRSFSNDLSEENPGDALTRGLASKVVHDGHDESRLAALRGQWSLFLVEGREMVIQSVPDDEVLLLSQSRKLYAAWANFRQRLPDDQRQELAGEVPSLQYLFRSVEKASESWQEERDGKTSGRLKQVFARLCNNFKDHSTLLLVLPKEDKYVCLLTGSLSAIAQASTNHQEIANAVADSLEELGQDMAYWNSLITGDTSLKTLHRYIRDLYVVVFEFLTSFDERAFEKLFSEKKGRICAIEQRMLHLTTLDFQIGVNEKVNKLEEGFQKIFECQEGSATDQRRLFLELGTSIQRLLDERADQRTLQITEVEHALALGSGIPLTLQPKHPQESTMAHHHPEFKEIVVSDYSYRRNGILDAIPLLKIACTHEIQALLDMTTQASQLMIDAEVQRQLFQWNKDPSFNNLWIQGPHEVSNPSQNTLAAVCLVALSRQNDIPCVFFFCALTPVDRGDNGQWSTERALMNMVKSLAIQLIFLLPETFVSMRNLSLNRFERLQNDLLGIEGTLDLLQDLRSLVPPYLHCVISGIEHLEDRGDEQHSRNLLRVLSTVTGGYKHSARADLHQHRDRANEQAEKVSESLQTTKTCFTTDGHADSLAQLVEQDCLMKVEYSDEAEQRPVEEIPNVKLPVDFSLVVFHMVAWVVWARQSDPRGSTGWLASSKSLQTSSNMSQPSHKPGLTPQFCFNETALRGKTCPFTSQAPQTNLLCLRADFLRLSRVAIDDSIIQNLNSLMTPARAGFDPSSTAERQTQTSRTRPLDPEACQGFKENVLFQSWQTRSDVLAYCAGVAVNPDDPDLIAREAESAKDRERVVDERLDPYSGRFFPREARTESLANLIRNERGVEGIIRARTWGLVTERCGDGAGWQEALDKWRATQVDVRDRELG
ncbi:MAG: hypothetical protein Q9210_004275 [Variospora velana]